MYIFLYYNHFTREPFTKLVVSTTLRVTVVNSLSLYRLSGSCTGVRVWGQWSVGPVAYKASEYTGFLRAMRMHSADCVVARCLSICPSVCLSVTRRYCVETAKCIINFFHRRIITLF